MPEYWFKYGVTEVSMEIPGEIAQKNLEFKRGEMDEKLWEKVRDFVYDLIKDSGSGRITILYDHSGDEFSTIILKHVVECFIEEGREEKMDIERQHQGSMLFNTLPSLFTSRTTVRPTGLGLLGDRVAKTPRRFLSHGVPVRGLHPLALSKA